MLVKLLNLYAGIILGGMAYGGWVILGATLILGFPLFSSVLLVLIVTAFVALAYVDKMESKV